MFNAPGNDLNLGRIAGRNAALGFSRSQRDKHLYCCGGTGTGKSKFLESLIRQDIIAWRKSKCAVIVLDPHGSLYDSLIHWLAWHEIDRPISPLICVRMIGLSHTTCFASAPLIRRSWLIISRMPWHMSGVRVEQIKHRSLHGGPAMCSGRYTKRS